MLCTHTLRSLLFPSPSNDQGVGAFFCWRAVGVGGLLGQGGFFFLCGVGCETVLSLLSRRGCWHSGQVAATEPVRPVAAGLCSGTVYA